MLTSTSLILERHITVNSHRIFFRTLLWGNLSPANHERWSLNSFKPSIIKKDWGDGEQGWHSGESTRLPPMGPGFDSRSRCHMWAEFVVGSRPCFESFFAGFSGFPPFTKTNISKFGLESVDEKPDQKATAKFQFIY